MTGVMPVNEILMTWSQKCLTLSKSTFVTSYSRKRNGCFTPMAVMAPRYPTAGHPAVNGNKAIELR